MMQTQLALNLGAAWAIEPAARNSDPVTSHQAAASAREVQAHHHRIILDCLRRHGPHGKDGIAARSGLTAYQVSKRMAELERLGQVQITGRVVKSTAGRDEREWRAV
jgi:predicted transcriptional regulator